MTSKNPLKINVINASKTLKTIIKHCLKTEEEEEEVGAEEVVENT